jgi:hypothetical protein
MRAISWMLACVSKLAGDVGPVEKIALCAVLRDEADEIVAELKWPREVEMRCDPR